MNELKNTLDLFIKEGKVNHSYMIETDSKNRKDIANLVIQEIIDKTNTKVSFEELKLNGDLIYIETDLQNIKKEEILDLKEKFNTSSIYSGIRVYVILEAEKLNASSANTLLKFLEEPNNDIYAVLLTNNFNKIITTIKSRCICIKLLTNNIELFEKDKEYLDFIFSFINIFEKHKEKSLAYLTELFPKEYIDRTKLKEIYTDLFVIYDEALHNKYNIKNDLFNEYIDIVDEIANNNQIKDLNRKMIIIDNNKNKLNYNTNLKLSLYNFILEMSGVDLND